MATQAFCSLLRAEGIPARLVCSLQPLDFTSNVPIVGFNFNTTDGQFKTEAKNDQDDKNKQDMNEFGAPVNNVCSPHPIYWVEVWDRYLKRWISIDPSVTEHVEVASLRKHSKFEPKLNDPANNMRYVLAFDVDGTITDVTRRYAYYYNAKVYHKRITSTEEGQEWYRKLLEPYRHKIPSYRDKLEQKEMEDRHNIEPLPNRIQDFKNHPVYVLERHLKQTEILEPRVPCGTLAIKKSGGLASAVPAVLDANSASSSSYSASLIRAGAINNQNRTHTYPGSSNNHNAIAIAAAAASSSTVEYVYRRSNVKEVRSARSWYQQGRILKIGAFPKKHITRKKTVGGLPVGLRGSTLRDLDNDDMLSDDNDDEDNGQIEVGLYSYDQTELYVPPPLGPNGEIPRNAYGNIDVFVPSMIPKGAVLLSEPRIDIAARLIGVDYAKAIVGFDFGQEAASKRAEWEAKRVGRGILSINNGGSAHRALARIGGIVVAKEYEEAVLAAYSQLQEEQEEEDKRQAIAQALLRWRRYLLALRIKARLNEQHGTVEDLEVEEQRLRQLMEQEEQKKQHELFGTGELDSRQNEVEEYDGEEGDDGEGGFIGETGYGEHNYISESGKTGGNFKEDEGKGLDDINSEEEKPFIPDEIDDMDGGFLPVKNEDMDGGFLPIEDEDMDGGFLPVIEDEDMDGGFLPPPSNLSETNDEKQDDNAPENSFLIPTIKLINNDPDFGRDDHYTYDPTAQRTCLSKDQNTAIDTASVVKNEKFVVEDTKPLSLSELSKFNNKANRSDTDSFSTSFSNTQKLGSFHTSFTDTQDTGFSSLSRIEVPQLTELGFDDTDQSSLSELSSSDYDDIEITDYKPSTNKDESDKGKKKDRYPSTGTLGYDYNSELDPKGKGKARVAVVKIEDNDGAQRSNLTKKRKALECDLNAKVSGGKRSRHGDSGEKRTDKKGTTSDEFDSEDSACALEMAIQVSLQDQHGVADNNDGFHIGEEQAKIVNKTAKPEEPVSGGTYATNNDKIVLISSDSQDEIRLMAPKVDNKQQDGSSPAKAKKETKRSDNQNNPNNLSVLTDSEIGETPTGSQPDVLNETSEDDGEPNSSNDDTNYESYEEEEDDDLISESDLLDAFDN